MNPNFRNFAVWVIILLVLVGLFSMFQNTSTTSLSPDIPYTQFVGDVEQDRVSSVEISGQQIVAEYNDGTVYKSYAPEGSNVVQRLEDRGVTISARPAAEEGQSLLSTILGWTPMLLILAVWIFFMRQMQGSGGKALGFGKSKAKLLTEAHGRKTFDDVAGVDEAKEDLEEIVEFLRDPQKFQRLGGRIPRGVLLVGPPGTGKTLLARAIAGEANVPFFTISGSDFVEMFVGVGASRVRDMFEQRRA